MYNTVMGRGDIHQRHPGRGIPTFQLMAVKTCNEYAWVCLGEAGEFPFMANLVYVFPFIQTKLLFFFLVVNKQHTCTLTLVCTCPGNTYLSLPHVVDKSLTGCCVGLLIKFT